MKKWWILIGLSGLVVLGYFHFSQPGLDNYVAMVERGQIEAVRDELGRELQRRPNWFEARMLLFEMELDQEDYLAALKQVIALAEGGYSVEDVTKEYRITLSQELSPLGIYRDSIDKLLEESSTWSRSFALELAMDSTSLELISRAAEALVEKNPDHPLLDAVWRQWRDRALESAWSLAVVMGEEYQSQVIDRIESIVDKGLRMRQIERLLAKTPDNPTLRMLRAGVLGGKPGLDILLSMEEQGTLPLDLKAYGELKFTLLAQSEIQILELTSRMLRHVVPTLPLGVDESRVLELMLALESTGWTPKDEEDYIKLKTDLVQQVTKDKPQLVRERTLEWVVPEVMFSMARSWLDPTLPQEQEKVVLRHSAVSNVLARLEEEPGWAKQVEYLRDIYQSPGQINPDQRIEVHHLPAFQEEGVSDWALSPDRKYIVASGRQTWLNRTTDGRSLSVPEDYKQYIPIWNAQGSHLALLPKGSGADGSRVWVYELNSSGRYTPLGFPGLEFLGWVNTTPVFARMENGQWQVTGYDLSSQVWRVLGEGFKTKPHISNQGEFYEIELGDTLKVRTNDGSELSFALPQGSFQVHDWLSKDQGLVLKSDDAPWNFWVVDFNGEVTPLKVHGFEPVTGGWMSETEVYGFYTLGLAKKLLKYNLETGSIEHTGITTKTGQWSSGGLVVLEDGRLNIYNLPSGS